MRIILSLALVTAVSSFAFLPPTPHLSRPSNAMHQLLRPPQSVNGGSRMFSTPSSGAGDVDGLDEAGLLMAQAAKLRADAAALEASAASDKAEAIGKAFTRLDKNQDGVVSFQELANGIKKEKGREPSDSETEALRRLFSEMDKDSSDSLQVSELTMTVSEMAVRMDGFVREQKDEKRVALAKAKEVS